MFKYTSKLIKETWHRWYNSINEKPWQQTKDPRASNFLLPQSKEQKSHEYTRAFRVHEFKTAGQGMFVSLTPDQVWGLIKWTIYCKILWIFFWQILECSQQEITNSLFQNLVSCPQLGSKIMLPLRYTSLPKIKGSIACIFQSNPRMCCNEHHEKINARLQTVKRKIYFILR